MAQNLRKQVKTIQDRCRRKGSQNAYVIQKKATLEKFGVRFPVFKCHTKVQSLPNLAMSMPLVDQEEVQPVSLPDFKVNDPLMLKGCPLPKLEDSCHTKDSKCHTNNDPLTRKGSPLPQQVPQLEDSVVDQAPAVLKIKTACEATPISARSDLMNKQMEKNLMEMKILTAKLDAGESFGSCTKDFDLTP